MAELWQNKLSDYDRVLNMSDDRVLNLPPVLNVPGLGIWQCCEYARVTQSFEYT